MKSALPCPVEAAADAVRRAILNVYVPALRKWLYRPLGSKPGPRAGRLASIPIPIHPTLHPP